MKTIHAFPRFDEFRAAVDAVATRTPFPEGRYIFYAETFEDMRRVFAGRPLEIPEARRPENDAIVSELHAVRKEVVLSQILAGSSEEPYYSIAAIVMDAFRQSTLIPTVSASDDRWLEVLHIARTYLDRRDSRMGAEPSGIKAPAVTFAHAVRFFNAKGIKVPLVGDNVMIESGRAWAALAATVVVPMEALGDTRAMQYLNAWLSSRFDPVIERVHLHATPNDMGMKVERSLPCGHLYRVAIRTLGKNRNAGRRPATAEVIGDVAKHFAALYEVEPFTTHESTFPPYPHKIIEMLQKVVLFDELFSIPQCAPDPMERLLRDLLADACGTGFIGEYKWSFSDALELWSMLLALAPRSSTSTFISREMVQRLLANRIGRVASDSLLKAFVLSNPNSGYHTPLDSVQADTRECAIAAASSNRYWIAPRPFLGPAFFSRLVSCLAKADRAISKKIGDAFEARMLRRLEQLGIRCRRVEVAGANKGAKAGDIDLLLETDQIVGLFEIKKKGLTRKTTAGNDLQMLVDLAQGLIHGVNQLTKHELTLMRTGKLVFTDGTVLSLGVRDIFKGVISLSDYGGLHDGPILRNTLLSFCQVTLNSNQSLTDKQQIALNEAIEEISTLQKRNKEFTEYIEKEMKPSNGNLFDNFVFHNVFFIEHLLLSVATAEDFLATLRMRNRIITGTRDQIFELEQFNTWAR